MAKFINSIKDNSKNSKQEPENVKRKRAEMDFKGKDLPNPFLESSKPGYQENKYLSQLMGIYNKLSQKGAFEYNAENDKAYQQYAAQYKALGDLAMVETQAAAEGLTGGYGSTYAPDVAEQVNNAYQANVTDALPLYYQMAQDKYYSDVDMINNQLLSAVSAAEAQDRSSFNQQQAWNDFLSAQGNEINNDNKRAYDEYNFERGMWQEQYWNDVDAQNQQRELAYANEQNKKDEQRAIYENNKTIVSNECINYSEKGDNKGLKSYLKGLVKDGVITQYDADLFYDKFKYEAPKSKSGGGSKSSSGGGGGSPKEFDPNNPGDDPYKSTEGTEMTSNWTSNIPRDSAKTKNGRENILKSIDSAMKNGILTEAEYDYLVYYYGL